MATIEQVTFFKSRIGFQTSDGPKYVMKQNIIDFAQKICLNSNVQLESRTPVLKGDAYLSLESKTVLGLSVVADLIEEYIRSLEGTRIL